MTFADPSRLWLLLTVAALAMAYLLLQLRRTRYALRFTNLHLLARLAPARPAWRRHVPAVLFLLMLFLLVVGFARPQSAERVPRERATVIVAVDISGSMAAEDVDPSRLEAASRAAVEFVDGLPGQFNVGVVAFAGTASTTGPSVGRAPLSATPSRRRLRPSRPSTPRRRPIRRRPASSSCPMAPTRPAGTLGWPRRRPPSQGCRSTRSHSARPMA